MSFYIVNISQKVQMSALSISKGIGILESAGQILSNKKQESIENAL